MKNGGANRFLAHTRAQQQALIYSHPIAKKSRNSADLTRPLQTKLRSKLLFLNVILEQPGIL